MPPSVRERGADPAARAAAAGSPRPATSGRPGDARSRELRRRRLARALRRRRALRLRVPAPARRRDVLPRARPPAARRAAGASSSSAPAAGRVTIPLARDGHEVVALDQSPAMLDRLRARVARAARGRSRARITPVEGDLRTFAVAAATVPARDRRVQRARAPLHARRGRRVPAPRRRAPRPRRRVRVRRPAPRPRLADPRPDASAGRRPGSPIRRRAARCSTRRTTTTIRSARSR